MQCPLKHFLRYEGKPDRRDLLSTAAPCNPPAFSQPRRSEKLSAVIVADLPEIHRKKIRKEADVFFLVRRYKWSSLVDVIFFLLPFSVHLDIFFFEGQHAVERCSASPCVDLQTAGHSFGMAAPGAFRTFFLGNPLES